jgi:hypothetical protein
MGGVGGVGVYVTESRGIIGADGQQGQLRRQSTADFFEAFKIGGIAGVIDRVLTRFQNVAAVAAVRILGCELPSGAKERG